MSAEDPIARARAEGRTTLTEPEAKRLLADFGIDTLEGALASTPEEAVERAADIGYPVVAKVASPAVTHKSEWADGVGVAVGLEDAGDVRSAAERIFAAAADREVDAEVYLEAEAGLDRGSEMIVGGVRDPSFGPTVLVGLGGVFTEIYEDTAHRLAPLSAREARTALEELRAIRLLRGYRDRPAADVDALAETVAAVGELLAQREAIAEIDVNPVLATADGATALDALIVLEKE
jgi:acetyl-CoA synthetase (ADP-forming)